MDHMTFDEFKEVLAEDLKESLYSRGYEDVEIGFNHTNKAKCNRRGFVPRKLYAQLCPKRKKEIWIKLPSRTMY